MSEHTPGEWEAVRPRKIGRRWRIVVRGVLGGPEAIGGVSFTWTLATIHSGAPGNTLETEAANASLFAASKDLLAACEAALEHLRGKCSIEAGRIREPLEAAIAKAKGKS